MKKSILSIILAVLMIICMIPLSTMTVFAEDSVHVHSITYTASGATITATCTSGCKEELDKEPVSFTLTEDLIAMDIFTEEGLAGWPFDSATGEIPLSNVVPVINYYKADDPATPLAGKPTAPGNYKVTVTFDDATAELEFAILSLHTHAWGDFVYNETHHWQTCTGEDCPVTDNSQMQSYGEHDWSNEDGICSVCNYECTHEGSTSTDFCSICGKSMECTHHYDSVFYWDWTAAADGFKVTACCKCAICGEGELVLPATVSTAAVPEGYITYTASVVLGETEYTTSKTDALSYTLEVVDGTIIGGLRADGIYYYNDLITVKADAPEEGKFFDGWYLDGEKVSNSQTFKFYLKTDSRIEARYADEVVEIKPQVALEFTDRVNVSGGGQQLKLIVRWELPQGYQPVEAGFVRTYEESCSKRLTLENVGGDIKKNSVAAVRNTGSYTLNVNMSAATSLKTLYYVGYLKCTNAAGKEIIVYTDLAQSAREPQ